MKYIYGILALLSILSGLYFLMAAKSAVHEIEGLILFLIAAVLFVAAEVREMIEKSQPVPTAQEKPQTGGD